MKKQGKIRHLYRKDRWERNNLQKAESPYVEVEFKELLKIAGGKKENFCHESWKSTLPTMNV